MYKGKKETTHERIGERKTFINIKKELSTMYVYKWSQDLMYKKNVSKKKKEKKIYIASSLHPSIITTLPLTKMSNSLPKNDYFHIQNCFPFLSRMTKGKNVK